MPPKLATSLLDHLRPRESVDQGRELILLDVPVVLLEDDIHALALLGEVCHLILKNRRQDVWPQVLGSLGLRHLPSLRLRHQLVLCRVLVDQETDLAAAHLGLAITVQARVDGRVCLHQVEGVGNRVVGVVQELLVVTIIIVIHTKSAKRLSCVWIVLVNHEPVNESNTKAVSIDNSYLALVPIEQPLYMYRLLTKVLGVVGVQVDDVLLRWA